MEKEDLHVLLYCGVYQRLRERIEGWLSRSTTTDHENFPLAEDYVINEVEKDSMVAPSSMIEM